MRHPIAPPRRPTVIACQGCVGLRPENTLAAISHAVTLGADGSEIDVQCLMDGTLVAHHDFALSPDMTRDSRGAWLDGHGHVLGAMSLADVRLFDVGRARAVGRTHLRYPDQVACDGQFIPTLAEILALYDVLGDTRSNLWIEVKTRLFAETDASAEIAQSLIATVNAFGAASRVTIIAFDWRVLSACLALSPDIATGFLTVDPLRLEGLPPEATGGASLDRLTGEARPWYGNHDPRRYGGDLIASVLAAGGTYWSPHHGDVTLDQVRSAHERGLMVSAWGADSQADIAACLARELDSVTTARPDWALQRLASS